MKERGSGKPKLTCRNWECGVLVPALARDASTQEAGEAGEGPGMLDLFRDGVPVAMEVPGSGYDSADSTKTPWFFHEG